MKKLLVLAALAVFGSAYAESEPVVPMFSELRVTVKQGEKPVYVADVVVPRNQAVVKDAITILVPKAVCEKNITVGPSEFKDGFRIALTANASPDKIVLGSYDYLFSTAKNDGYKDFGVGCKREEITAHETAASGGYVMRGDDKIVAGDLADVTVTLSLKGVYNSAPEGKTPGVFYPVK